MAKSTKKPTGMIISVVVIFILAGGLFGAWKMGLFGVSEQIEEVAKIDPATLCQSVEFMIDETRGGPRYCYNSRINKFEFVLENTGEVMEISGFKFDVSAEDGTIESYDSSINLTYSDFKKYYVPFDSTVYGFPASVAIFPKIKGNFDGEYVCEIPSISTDTIFECAPQVID